jgi:hypothetical protein
MHTGDTSAIDLAGTTGYSTGELSGTTAIRALTLSAAAGLVQMLDPRSQLFCHRFVRTADGFNREGVSQRYTIMTLLGLHRLETANAGDSPINIDSIVHSLFADYSWITSIGDLGLMLWVTALVSPDRMAAMSSELRVDSALDCFKDAREGRVMELAWFLTGLSYAALRFPQKRHEFERLAMNSYRLLKRNQGAHGFFGHQFTGGPSSCIRRRVGSFADQVYPIYAFSRFGQAYGADEAVGAAQKCADSICRTQGAQGQWWWHYESSTGRVLQRYPVYSVHQDGMAPMALFALSDAAGLNYSEAIYKGLNWIGGGNELSTDLRDCRANLIWRNIYCAGRGVHTREFFSFLFGLDRVAPARRLRVLFECRPYHLGWLLYAFAGRSGKYSESFT